MACQNVISTGPDASSSAPVGQSGWSASGDSVVVGAIVAGAVESVADPVEPVPVESVGPVPPSDPPATVDGAGAIVSGSSMPACNADLPDPQAAATAAPTISDRRGTTDASDARSSLHRLRRSVPGRAGAGTGTGR